MTAPTITPPPPPRPPRQLTPARRGLRSWLDPNTTEGRRRILGLVIFVALFALFFTFNRFPKLDTVREDVEIATTAARAAAEDLPVFDRQNCFQGFCVEPEKPFLVRWWQFSITYLDLVTIGMIFAFLVAGLAEALIFPATGSGAFGKRRGLLGSLQGLTVGPAMNLCSACIVPVANSFKKQGADVEATVAVTQGSSTLNAPAMFMVFAMFTPVLAVSRVVMGVIGALFFGPLVAWVIYRRRRARPEAPDDLDLGKVALPTQPWAQVIREGLADWLAAAWRFFIRLAPIMIVAGFISGLFIQWLTPEVVERFLGNHALGIVLAATFGILINVPLLFEIPLVAALMLLGMGTAPAATLLFTAAAGGPITFWGLAKQIPTKGVAALAGATWLLGTAGGVTLLGLGLTPEPPPNPVVTFDGACHYDGPAELPAAATEFTFRNELPDVGDDKTLTVTIGLLPDEPGAYDRLVADVTGARADTMPAYLWVAGEESFVFPESEKTSTITLHRPGAYAAVCLHGGGFYVVSEFSMPQPTGWFDEFRNTFDVTVADATFAVVD